MKTTALQVAINAPTIVQSDKYIQTATQPVTDVLSFDEVKFACQRLADAAKSIEEARKKETDPLNAEVKRLIAIEREYTTPLLDAVNKGKSAMLAYQNELARVEREANEKAAAQAAERLLSGSVTEAIEQVPQLIIDKPKGLRTVKKARINGAVDWAAVVGTLIAADKFDPEMLLKGLPDAMSKANVREIAGIEIYEHTTQTLR